MNLETFCSSYRKWRYFFFHSSLNDFEIGIIARSCFERTTVFFKAQVKALRVCILLLIHAVMLAHLFFCFWKVLLRVPEYQLCCLFPVHPPKQKLCALCFQNKYLDSPPCVVLGFELLFGHFLTVSALLIFIGADGNESCTSPCYCTADVCFHCECENSYLG